MKLTKKAAYEAIKADPTMLYRPMPEEYKALFPVISADIAHEMGLHITTKHTGKMTGMDSLSTTCKCNGSCIDKMNAAFRAIIDGAPISKEERKNARAILKKYIEENPLSEEICICAFCFSDAQQDSQETMQIPLRRNYDLLNNGIIHPDWLPIINTLYFRGESFGDFASVDAVINFYNLAACNPAVNFTAWTKNLVWFGKAAEMGYNKPANFKLVYFIPLHKQGSKDPGKVYWTRRRGLHCFHWGVCETS